MKDKDFYIRKLEEITILENTIYQYLELCIFNKGDCLLYQGQTLEYLYILLDGSIKSCHSTSNGTTVINAFSSPITVLGEIEFLNQCDVNNSVYAMEETICFRISIIQYKDMLLNDLFFMRYLAKTIADKLQSSNNNTSISINYPVENRLASYFIASHNQLIINQNFVQTAEMIGCSYRQLQRTLTMFCKNGYIKKTGRSIFCILNLKALESLGKDLYHL